MMEMFLLYPIQHSSHWMHVAIEHLKNSVTEFLILFNSIWFKFKSSKNF